MDLETRRKFTIQDDDLELVTDEDSSLSQNISILRNNEFRLFLDCDNRSVHETTIKNHDFNFLVKTNPFQKAPQPEFWSNGLKINENENKLCDLSTSSSARKDESSPLDLSPVQEKVITFAEYNGSKQTYPKGILKLGEKSKYSGTSAIELRRVQRQISLGQTRWAIDWDSVENKSSLSDLEEAADLNSNLHRGMRVIKSQNKDEDLPPIFPAKKPSLFKIQVNKVRKILSSKKSCETKARKDYM